MKKILLSTVVLCSFLASSCRDDNDNKQLVEETYATLIIGKWKLTKQQIVKSGNGEIIETNFNKGEGCYTKNFEEYTKDGKYITKDYFKKDNSEDCEEQIWETTYSINQSNATLKVEGLLDPNLKILTLNKGELKTKGLWHDEDKDGKKDYKIYTYQRIK